ncbi:hypothetical protein [Streptomyces sp. NPDC004008]
MGVAEGHVVRDAQARGTHEPGRIAQCDLWFPETRVQVGAGQQQVQPVLVAALDVPPQSVAQSAT